MRNATCAALVALAGIGLSACNAKDEEASAPDAPTTRHWRCGDTLLETRILDHALSLRLPGATHRLKAEATASGTRYGNAAGMQFWSKGDDAAVFRRGADQPERTCQPSEQRSPWLQAAEAAIDLRATGNEPGWMLEAYEDGSLTLRLDYGQRTLHFAERSPLAAGRGFSASSADHQLKVSVSDVHTCTDSMSGERFPLTVRIRVDDASPLSGCGRHYSEPDAVTP